MIPAISGAARARAFLARRTAGLLVALLLVACQAQPAPAQTTAPATVPAPAPTTVTVAPTASPTAAPVADFSGQRAWQDVDYLASTIGSRPAGSPAQDQAADYLAAQYAAAGLTTSRQTFEFTAFEDRGSQLQVTGPQQFDVRATTLEYSAGGDVTGEVVDVGLARPGDFDPAAVAGKVALAARGEIRFGEKVSNLAAAGATAVLIANNQPGGFSGSLGAPAALPAVGLSGDDGEQLRSLVQSKPTTVRLRVDALVSPRTGQNVVATHPGGPRVVVLGAHYDSVSAGPGANDNGSGTATLLELARATAGRHYPFTLRFIAFGAEEVGLVGSRHYVESLDPSERSAIVAMINLDMVGVGDRLAFGGSDELVARALDLASQASLRADRLRGSVGSASDHASFAAAGMPAVFIYRAEDPHYHSADDRAAYVSADNLAVAGRLVLALLDQLATAGP